jgi:anti-sigma regulatory factor (Ser/Thr protein kinase)
VTKLAVPHEAASAAAVRHRLAADLAAAGVDAAVRADAELVLTELVTNAVRHAPPLDDNRIAVGWRHTGSALLLWVSDGGSERARPRRHHAAPTETSGRGLAIVEALTDDWGVRSEPDRRTVWAELRAAAAPAERCHASG